MNSTIDNLISPQLTGQVKWFNNKAGFGFITVLNEHDNFSGKEIFVHFTSIDVKNNQYKYLVQGEYVEFSLVKLDGGDHEFHAVNVHGIKGGSLMCETRKQTNEERDRISRPVKDNSRKDVAEEVVAEVSRRTTPRRSATARPNKGESTPRTTREGEGEYKKVVRKRSVKSVREPVAEASAST